MIFFFSFRHLSHCKYKKELDLLFGVQPQAAESLYPEAKRPKLAFTSGPSYLVDKPYAMHNCSQVKVHKLVQTWKNEFFIFQNHCNGHVRVPEQHHVHSLCQRTYAPESCCDRVQDSNALHEENAILKKQICELRQRVLFYFITILNQTFFLSNPGVRSSNS